MADQTEPGVPGLLEPMADEEEVRDLSRERGRPDRQTRADDLVEEREERARLLKGEAAERARAIAFEEGEWRAETRAHILGHESRLNAVNGNIRLAAKRSEEQTQSIDSLHDSIRDLVAKAETKEAVDLALQKRLEDAQKSQLGRWSAFWAAAAVIVTLLGVMVALLSAVHAL